MSRGGGTGTESGTGSLLRRLRDSETRRLELERKLMEYKKSDAYLMKLKYTKLKKYLEEINERQKRALLRNQAILKELKQFEAHMKTSSSELIQKMEWYGREIKSVLSLREGNLSAQGDEREYNKQAPPLLREVLPEEECGDRSSIQSNESSYSSPSIPNDGREIKQAKHAPRLDGTGKQEVTSWCEDESQEESVIKKIPITGCGIGNDSSKTKESQEICSESSSSSERSGDLSRTEVRKGFVTAIKSKAFWGVSDDSSSESEAALHPQIHSTADEFDFYD
ncbi:centrosomal protein kizuna isoform X3 [Cygnus olor]|uniref:centrosomal protein kizuna isoform X3 n=1 Tax=Cygnus olor TaxID=8869 RepID=UPI001ADE370B|nr:centrosomal protein kizuna isoform X3 [Cygnus olor]